MNCFRCGNPVPEPDLKEAIAREQDWRDFVKEQKVTDEERVLICMPCADELEELENE